MRALSASELLEVWEGGQSGEPFRRAQALLEAACPELSAGEVADLPIGHRDRRLLTLRELTFGSRLTAVAACPACGAALDVGFETNDLVTTAPDDGSALVAEIDGYLVEFRLPNGRDLALVGARNGDHDGDAAGAGRGHEAQLLERCTRVALRGGVPVAAADLPAGVVDAVVEAMADADPQVDMEMALTCPACGHGWQTPFDIVTYFWSEIDAWARRTVREVHALASAYGWSESAILAMTPRRRQMYLELVG